MMHDKVRKNASDLIWSPGEDVIVLLDYGDNVVRLFFAQIAAKETILDDSV